jgi:hypothetical protein
MDLTEMPKTYLNSLYLRLSGNFHEKSNHQMLIFLNLPQTIAAIYIGIVG